MVEHFLLTPAELQLVLTCRGDANSCGMALLLKTISHLGYVPDQIFTPWAPGKLFCFLFRFVWMRRHSHIIGRCGFRARCARSFSLLWLPERHVCSLAYVLRIIVPNAAVQLRASL